MQLAVPGVQLPCAELAANPAERGVVLCNPSGVAARARPGLAVSMFRSTARAGRAKPTWRATVLRTEPPQSGRASGE